MFIFVLDVSSARQEIASIYLLFIAVITFNILSLIYWVLMPILVKTRVVDWEW